ncbi:hypothetical protein [uncultured Rubinisphaera sp.]|uniref:hypothetical protein n=1 Tax=uncultured Rubinisphaera sp. TaxID=1678686 RepID=UPI0030DC8D41
MIDLEKQIRFEFGMNDKIPMDNLEQTTSKAEVSQLDSNSNKKATVKKATAKKKTVKKKNINSKKATKKNAKIIKKIERPYPRVELQEAVKVPLAIREHNAGHPWNTEEVKEALADIGITKGNPFFYTTAASRDFGLTEGSRDTTEISLTDLGKRLAFAESAEVELSTRLEAFQNVEIFNKVLDHYQGASLPEMKYLQNTLQSKFGLDPEVHEEFANLFRKNCEYLGITEGGTDQLQHGNNPEKNRKLPTIVTRSDFVTVAEPENDTGLLCFVAMPFSEKSDNYPQGFFKEVLNQIIAPAGRQAGFRVVTAIKQGSGLPQE